MKFLVMIMEHPVPLWQVSILMNACILIGAWAQKQIS